MSEIMTKDQIINSTSEVLTSVNVSGVLQANPATIRLQAAQRPELLGFPVIVAGTRVKIPRIPFIRFMGWE